VFFGLVDARKPSNCVHHFVFLYNENESLKGMDAAIMISNLKQMSTCWHQKAPTSLIKHKVKTFFPLLIVMSLARFFPSDHCAGHQLHD